MRLYSWFTYTRRIFCLACGSAFSAYAKRRFRFSFRSICSQQPKHKPERRNQKQSKQSLAVPNKPTSRSSVRMRLSLSAWSGYCSSTCCPNHQNPTEFRREKRRNERAMHRKCII